LILFIRNFIFSNMKILLPGLFISFIFFTQIVYAQCPTNEADLADGGTFSGTCSIAVGGSIVITGAVVWSSGTLSITGSNGDIDINGGSLTINGGTVQAVDGNDGDLDVISGSITIAAGANLLVDESIQVFNGASITVGGSLRSQDSFIDIDAGGTITVSATGTIQSSSTGGNEDILIQGTLINNGTVDSDEDIIVSATGVITNSSSGTLQADDDIDINGSVTNAGVIDSNDDLVISGSLISSGQVSANDDIEVNGGSVTISAGGTLDTGDDLFINNGGSFTIATGASIVIDDDIEVGGPGQGSLVVNGTLTANDDLTVNNTTPNSSLTGVGVINVDDNYSDAECPGSGNFCGCVGAGVGSCSSVLPVELVSFSAVLEGSSVILEWETASELNSDYFTIQRMSTIDSFENLLSEKGKGTTQEKSNYRVVDPYPVMGKNYYRLKQTDFDGTSTYSKIILVENNQAEAQVTLYPNPICNQNLHLKGVNLTPDTRVRLLIMRLYGTIEIDSQLQSNRNGSVEVTLQTSDWPSGIYVIQLGAWTGKVLVL
jgi:hypothetical protein